MLLVIALSVDFDAGAHVVDIIVGLVNSNRNGKS